MNTSENKLLEIKEIKIIHVDVIQDAQNAVNKHLKDGWVITAIEKYVSENDSESIYYHLARL